MTSASGAQAHQDCHQYSSTQERFSDRRNLSRKSDGPATGDSPRSLRRRFLNKGAGLTALAVGSVDVWAAPIQYRPGALKVVFKTFQRMGADLEFFIAR